MEYEDQQPRLFDGDRWGRRPPPGLKSFLLILNLQIDWILDNIYNATSAYRPIIFAEGETEIEKLTLALEDRWYFGHSGIDWRAVPRVLRQIVTLKRVGGVSTIEQQLVRTVLERRERTINRKSRELVLAWILSHRMSKRAILRSYLDMAYFGYRLRGCDEVARILFAMNSPQLNKEQAALVASLLVYPLPSTVLLGVSYLYPISNIDEFLNSASVFAPKWAFRVRRRMKYGLSRIYQTKKSRN